MVIMSAISQLAHETESARQARPWEVPPHAILPRHSARETGHFRESVENQYQPDEYPFQHLPGRHRRRRIRRADARSPAQERPDERAPARPRVDGRSAAADWTRATSPRPAHREPAQGERLLPRAARAPPGGAGAADEHPDGRGVRSRHVLPPLRSPAWRRRSGAASPCASAMGSPANWVVRASCWRGCPRCWARMCGCIPRPAWAAANRRRLPSWRRRRWHWPAWNRSRRRYHVVPPRIRRRRMTAASMPRPPAPRRSRARIAKSPLLRGPACLSRQVRLRTGHAHRAWRNGHRCHPGGDVRLRPARPGRRRFPHRPQVGHRAHSSPRRA